MAVSTPIHKPGQRPPRYLVYARHKQGKSTFVSTAPDVLILDPESGTEHLSQSVDVWSIRSWSDIDKAYRYLSKGGHKYRWVGVDGLTRMYNMALTYIMRMEEERDLDRRPGMVDLRDYNKAGELMKGMLYNFHNLANIGVIFTAHEKAEDAQDMGDFGADPEDIPATRFVPSLPPGVRSAVEGLADVIGRLYTTKVTGIHPTTKKEVTILQRRLWISPRESLDTGYRSQHKNLPDYLKNPSVSRLTTLISEGATK